MEEVFPVLTGIAAGLALHTMKAGVIRSVLLALFGVAFGVMAAWISGELEVSWVYALIDVAQVLGVAVLTDVLVTVWRRRRAAYRHS